MTTFNAAMIHKIYQFSEETDMIAKITELDWQVLFIVLYPKR
jgi:hypothetical protein